MKIFVQIFGSLAELVHGVVFTGRLQGITQANAFIAVILIGRIFPPALALNFQEGPQLPARKWKQRAQKIKQIEELEHKGDELTHEIFSALGSTFITPFDREDIHALASKLDDILDYIQGAATRIEEFTRGKTLEDYLADAMLRSAGRKAVRDHRRSPESIE